MKTKNILIVVFLLSSLICKAEYITLTTPNGSKVLADAITYEFPDSQIEYINQTALQQYPNARIIDNASNRYNCHAYAWYLSEGGTTKCWIFGDVKYYWEDGSYVETSESEAEKVYYDGGDHSAIISSTHPGKYESKWGQWPLMRHAPGYAPYPSTQLKFYKKANNTELTWRDIYISLTQSGSSSYFEIKFHSNNNTVVSFDPNDYNAGRTNYKAEWLINNNWGWLSDAWKWAEYDFEPMTNGRLYWAMRQGDFYQYNYGGYRADYTFSRIAGPGNKWRFSFFKESTSSLSEFVIPIQLKITERNGAAPLIYNIALLCRTLGGDNSTWEYLFPVGRADNPPASYSTKSINFENNIQLNDKVDITIYDLNGKQVFLKKNSGNDFNIYHTPLNDGIYIIEKRDGVNRTSEKIILRR